MPRYEVTLAWDVPSWVTVEVEVPEGAGLEEIDAEARRVCQEEDGYQGSKVGWDGGTPEWVEEIVPLDGAPDIRVLPALQYEETQMVPIRLWCVTEFYDWCITPFVFTERADAEAFGLRPYLDLIDEADDPDCGTEALRMGMLDFDAAVMLIDEHTDLMGVSGRTLQLDEITVRTR